MSQDNIKALYDLIQNGATDSEWIIAKELKKQIDETNAKRKEKAKEEHRLVQIEKQKPENRYPEVWNFKHVYPQELTEYCKTYDLNSLKTYLQQLENGQHQSDFKKDSFDNAATFLRSRINERKNTTKPNTPTPTIQTPTSTAMTYTI